MEREQEGKGAKERGGVRVKRKQTYIEQNYLNCVGQ